MSIERNYGIRNQEGERSPSLSFAQALTKEHNSSLPIIDSITVSHPLDKYLNTNDASTSEELANIADLLSQSYIPTTKVFTFHDLGQINLDEVFQVNPDSTELSERQEKLLVIKQFIEHTRERWAEMKARGHDVEEDPPEQLLKLVTAPSAYLITFRATKLAEQDCISTKYSHFLGYGLIQLDRNDFPDAASIPDEIYQMGKIHRGLRIMVNNVGNSIAPGGGGVKMIVDEVKKIINDGILITKILVSPPELAYKWSKLALEREGFYDSGETSTQKVFHQGKEIELTFALYALSNSTEEGTKRIRTIEEKYNSLDIATRQRFADTFAHFPPHDACLAVWSGDSGSDVAHYGSIYDRNYVLGVELNRRTTPEYQFNVRHTNGDEAIQIIPPKTFDGVINLSVLSEVIDLAKGDKLNGLAGDKPIEIIESFLRKQLETTQFGKRNLTRDWFVPESWSDSTIIEVSTLDGSNDGTIYQLDSLSTAKRLEFYSQHALSSDRTSIGFKLEELPTTKPGFKRYKLDSRHAYGFTMQKDFTSRSDFEREAKKLPEFKASQICQIIENLGARIISSEPRYNEYITNERIRDKIYFYTQDGAPLPTPPTQHVVLYEKIGANQGTKFKITSLESTKFPSFVKLALYKDSLTGEKREIAARPGQTIEFHVSTPQGYELIVDGFPRPILSDSLTSPSLEESIVSGHVPQPLAGIVDKGKNLRDEAYRLLYERAGIEISDIDSITFRAPYFPSPTTTDELITQCDVKLKNEGFRERTLPGSYSGFHDSGQLRMVPQEQILQALQGGSFLDERIARSIMMEKIRDNKPLGPWIGNKISLTPQDSHTLRVSLTEDLIDNQAKIDNIKRWHEVTDSKVNFQYLDIKRVSVSELNSQGHSIASATREFVEPLESSGFSSNTIITLPILQYRGRPTLVLYMRQDLPVIESQLGLNSLLTVPTYRLSRSINNFKDCDQFLQDSLHKDFGLKLLHPELTPIGRWFPPSAGVLNERSWLRVAEVDADSIDPNKVILVDLEEHAKSIAHLGSFCGNLQTAVFRLYHAFN